MFKHVDCFAGVGGVATGFHAAGLETQFAVEKVESCVDTYKKNHPDVQVIHQDIRHVTDTDVEQLCPAPVDIVTAGMPCETFSTAGSSSRSFYDHRQTLFEEAIRIARKVQARIILFENVPGFANKRLVKNEPLLVIDYLKAKLVEAGYTNICIETLNSADFGLPQIRKRLFVLASNDASLDLRCPQPSANTVTVGEAFANLPYVDVAGPKQAWEFTNVSNAYCELMANGDFWNREATNSCTYQKSPNHRDRTIKRFAMIRTGEGLKCLFDRLGEKKVAALQQERILPKKWFIQRNRRLDPKAASPTVTSHCLDELLHPNLNRSITVREAARLQGFPDSYDFCGGPEICPHIYETQDKYEQIGDAVPPLMAYHWALTLKEILNDTGRLRQRVG